MTDRGIAAFWEEWPRLRAGLEREIASGEYGEATAGLTDLAEDIDPNLEWELAPGRAALYALCLSAAADPGLRPLTERWVRAAPPPDPIWEYHPARLAVEPSAVAVDGVEFHPAGASAVIELDSGAEELDVTVGHPSFGLIDEALRLQVVFRFLDDLLGEDAADLWIGGVDAAPEALPWGVPFLELAEEVERLAAAAEGVRWEWSDEDDYELGASRLAVNRALKRLHHLDLELFVTVSVDEGAPGGGSAQRVEESMTAAFGAGAAVFARRVFDGFTVIYAYLDPACEGALDEWAEGLRPAVYEVTAEPDPGWGNHDAMR